MKKLRVGVLMGGSSAEREVSLVTGKAICDNLDRKKYAVTPIGMTRDHRFFVMRAGKKQELDFYKRDRKRFDLVFIALHGTFGEDGSIQGFFQILGIPYTGSSVLGSAMAMNKKIAAQLYRQHGLLTPDFRDITKNEWTEKSKAFLKEVGRMIGFPAVVKPVDQGSAVGVGIVNTMAELKRTMIKNFKLFSWLMIQQYVNGAELTCGVLEKRGEVFALPPTRILPALNNFYDYKSKYASGGSYHICPADFSMAVNKRIQELAVRAHKALECRGMSRTDMFITDTDAIYVIETNTIPGMTPTSLLPEAAAAAGMLFPMLLDLIIASSLKK